MSGLLRIGMILIGVQNFNVVVGTVSKSNDFNNYIRRRFKVESALICVNQRLKNIKDAD